MTGMYLLMVSSQLSPGNGQSPHRHSLVHFFNICARRCEMATPPAFEKRDALAPFVVFTRLLALL